MTHLPCAALALVFLLGGSTLLDSAERLFHGGERLGVGSSNFVLADFDEDGRLDVAVRSAQRTLDVRLGTGGGGFDAEPVARLNTFFGAFLHVGDQDLDGSLDLVLVGRNSVSIVPGRGDGTFDPEVRSTVPAFFADASHFADFDGDRRGDVAVLDNGRLRVFYSTGRSGFVETTTPSPVGAPIFALRAVDIDGDLISDLLVEGPEGLRWHRGLGSRAFAPARAIDIELEPTVALARFSSADLDADDLADLVVWARDGRLIVLFAAGGGSFLPRVVGVSSRLPDEGSFLDVGDLDGDTRPEILFSSAPLETGRLESIRISETRESEEGAPLETALRATRFSPVVLVENELPAVLATQADTGVLVLFRALGAGRFSSPQVVSSEVGVRSVAVLGAPASRIVAVAAERVEVFATSGESLTRIGDRSFAGRDLRIARAIDIDANGRDDLVLLDRALDAVLVTRLDAPGAVEDPVVLDTLDLPIDVVAGDFDHDGAPDLVVAHRSANVLRWIRAAADASRRTLVDIDLGTPQQALASGDFDRDGRDDLAVVTREGVAVVLLSRAGLAGGFERREVPGVSGLLDLEVLEVDGRPGVDLVGVTRSEIVLVSDLLNAVGDSTRVALPETPSALRALDIDGIGGVEMLVLGLGSLIVVRLDPDTDTLRVEESYVGGELASAFDLGDVDGDGALDAVLADFGAARLLVLGAGDEDPDRLLRRGDVDQNGRVDLSDSLRVLDRLFRGGAEIPCLDAADIDDDGAVLLSDAVLVLLYLFRQGTPPSLPGPTRCGPDPRRDRLPRCPDPCL